MKGCFITGTDTDAGKTTVCAALLRLLLTAQVDAQAIKPVQTGCTPDASGILTAPDTTCYAEAIGEPTKHTSRAHVLKTFVPACSPHLAAEQAGTSLSVSELTAACHQVGQQRFTLIEGAGGLYVPLNDHEHMLDLMRALALPVLLVVGNRLGCINHALLSIQALRAAGLPLLGLILCRTHDENTRPKPASETALEAVIRADNVRVLARSGIPVLADLPFLPGLAKDDSRERDAAWAELADRLHPVLSVLNPPPALPHSQTAPSQTAQQPAKQPSPNVDQKEKIAADLNFDRDHLWHPYTSATDPLPVHEAVGAEGVRIHLRTGETLIDGMASWWCAIHGYRHPVLVRAAQEHAARLPHIMFGGLTHAPAITLGQKLLDMLPHGLQHLFYADSGSVAVEVALKMATQYWQATGQPRKTTFVALRGGYHGDTLGAMSVCDPVTGMHSLFSGLLPQNIFAERPTCRFDQPFDPASLNDLKQILTRNADQIAAVILEPIVQGAGGMWFYHPDYLRGVRNLCDELNILLIADEIATGFGRTGKLFAVEWAGITPDILCLGKALTGGMMTLSAVAAIPRVAHGISQNGGVFMHGPTFMANPLACAVACASLDLLLRSPWQERVQHMEQNLAAGLAPCRELPGIRDVRALGAIGVVETEAWVNVPSLQRFFVAQGVWVRPFGHAVYLMPPYIMNDTDLHTLTQAVFRALAEGKHL